MEAQFKLLKQFIEMCKVDSTIIHHPGLAFFRDYIESLGGKIPEPKKQDAPKSEPKKPEPAAQPMESEPAAEEEREPEIPYPEIDNSGVLEADDGAPLPKGDVEKLPTDEDLEKAGEERDAAMAAFSEGEFEKALEHYTNAIVLQPTSAILFAKRANVLLKLKRPVAAIADCNMAISINPDSAQGYKFRGRAQRLLGKWVEAHTDLATACKLDYDDTANEWLKETDANAKKLQEYNRAVERQTAERELKERRERVRRAQEANRKAAEEAAAKGGDDDDFDFAGMAGAGAGAGGMGGMGGFPGCPAGAGPGMAGMADLFNNPEVVAAMKDPEVMGAFMDIMQNPGNIMKYMNNPKVMKVISMMKGPGGAAGPEEEGGCCGGHDDGHGHSHDHDEPSTGGFKPAPTAGKAPEPDLD